MTSCVSINTYVFKSKVSILSIKSKVYVKKTKLISKIKSKTKLSAVIY